MFDDDEEELELLRQYENKDLAEDDDNLSSDGMDSDLEDKIMSMVQYGTGIAKKKAPPSKTHDDVAATAVNDIKLGNVDSKVVYAPTDVDKQAQETPAFSSANEFRIDVTDSDSDDINLATAYSDEESNEEDIGVPELAVDIPIKKNVEQPQVTRFINMDDEDKRYLDDEETSEEETELGLKLQKLIDDQIYNRQSKKRFLERPVRVCFSCNQPGHERVDCKLCIDCGGPRHKESRCLGARYCARCKYRGHNAMDCENPKTLGNCSRCNASYHHSDMCPSLLHTYVGEVVAKSTPIAWCYNCTERGHYGDECPLLPQYKTTIPSVFSKLSLGLGSRFDPKKAKKSSPASSYQQGYTSKHQRWSDDSRESSPRRDYYDTKRVRPNYNDSDDDYSSRYTSKQNNNNKNKKNNDSGNLNGFFSHQLPPASKNKQNHSRSGNSNWKALNNNSLPQPTRSGTVNVSSYSNNRQQRQDYGDFPRGDNSNLPKPSSSGVIDLTGGNSNNNNPRGDEYANRRPKYHGGYSRNR